MTTFLTNKSLMKSLNYADMCCVTQPIVSMPCIVAKSVQHM